MRLSLMVILAAIAAVFCLSACQGQKEASGLSKALRSSNLYDDYTAMLEASGSFGEGGKQVLAVAANTLAKGKAEGKWPDVGLEDLWAHAIKEGRGLFNDPEKRWGDTGPEMTGDMIDQTTVGPWQVTLDNIQNRYGEPYGVDPDWEKERVYSYMRRHPEHQAAIASDIIQRNYDDWSVRGPFAIQSYFWLLAYVKGEIGQADWDVSVLSDEDRSMKETGFYAKQIVCGSKTNPYGLLYWLWATGKPDEIRQVLETWKNQKEVRWNEEKKRFVRGADNAMLAIKPQDLRYLKKFPEAHGDVSEIAKEVFSGPIEKSRNQ